jgi:uncharacterized membrane protein YhaH (DUF805 family)
MLHFFFGFHGRIRRTNYFFGALLAGLVYCSLSLSDLAASGIRFDDRFDAYAWSFDPSPAGYAGFGILTLIALWASVALTVKRWHDVGVTGWFSILSLPFVTHGVMFILLSLLPGTTGPNRYGPDPRGRLAPAPIEPAVA